MSTWPPAPGSTWRLVGGRIRQVTGYITGDDGVAWAVKMRHPDGGPEEDVTKIDWEAWIIEPKPVEFDL